MDNPYRSHCCDQIEEGVNVKLCGWVHRKRDHGGLLFIDLRDHYGLVQLVFNENTEDCEQVERIPNESVIFVSGKVRGRDSENINNTLHNGHLEVLVSTWKLESKAKLIPIQVNSSQDSSEELRLRYRFLDLRRERVRKNILMRSQVMQFIRVKMYIMGFNEFNTPILTASSPEGARDFLVPSREFKGKFYALPQAPQQFKQLLMIAGFDKYFQLAPCFRDEDSRADRSPGDFYQLDLEMSFVVQGDIFKMVEELILSIFTKFSSFAVEKSFPHITYKDAMLHYGCDKPDLRNPLIIHDVTDIFRDSGFTVFAENVAKGMVVRAIACPDVADKPRSFFDKKIDYTMSIGAKGLGYMAFDDAGNTKGPVGKFLDEGRINELRNKLSVKPGDAIFFASDKEDEVCRIAGDIRNVLGQELGLYRQDVFQFCWVVDFPYYKMDPFTGKIDFFHNPFSMPQGGMEELSGEQPMDILAYQYDLVCNGIELASGAIRNHRLEVMEKAFAIAGYNVADIEAAFPGLSRALQYGAPPHGGIAFGIERMLMLLVNESSIREVICFPMNQKGEDVLMGAPSEISDAHLKELGLKVDKKASK